MTRRPSLPSHRGFLYLTWLMILVVVPLPPVLILNISLVESPSNLIVYDCGIVAYVWWLTAVILSSRSAWLERRLGLPSIYFIHGMVGLLGLALATIHVLRSFSMHAIIRNTGHLAWYLSILGFAYAVLFLSGWLVDRFRLVYEIKRHLEHVFSHRLSIWAHRLNLVAIALIWIHVHVIPRIRSNTPFILIFDAYTVLALSIYIWCKLIAPTSPKRQGRLVENRELAPGIRRIAIEFGPQAANWKPGDFYFVSFPHSVGLTGEQHPFSVTRAQQEVDPCLAIFTVKAVGDYTGRLKSVPLGSAVLLEGPFGQFDRVVSALPADRPLVLLGMGVGISPLIGLAEAYQGRRSIHLLWSVHREESEILKDELDTLLSNHTDCRLDRQDHRFTLADIDRLLSPAEIETGLFLIVGSAPGVLQTEHLLKKLSVGHNRLFDERLTM